MDSLELDRPVSSDHNTRQPLLLGLMLLLVFPAGLQTAAANLTEQGLVSHEAIWVLSDGEFTADRGVVGGSGSEADPYIIEGWDIDGFRAPLLPPPENDYLRASVFITNTTSHFVIRNVHVHDGWGGHLGIVLWNVTNAAVESVTVRNGNAGVYMTATRNSTVVSSEFFGLEQPIVIWAGPSPGMTATGNLVMGNTIHDDFSDMYVGSGITLSAASMNVVRDNTISKVVAGVQIFRGSSNNMVVGNHIFDTLAGVNLWPGTHYNGIENNRIEIVGESPHPNFGPVAGISIGQENTGNIARGNWISGYSHAIGMNGAHETIVSDNVLNATEVGVLVISSEEGSIARNTISASETGVLILSSNETEIVGNLIDVASGTGGSGVWVGHSYRTNITGNTVVAPVGVTRCESLKTKITHNDFTGTGRRITYSCEAP